MADGDWSIAGDLTPSFSAVSDLPMALLDDGLSEDGYAADRELVADRLVSAADSGDEAIDHTTALGRFDASFAVSKPKFIWEKGSFLNTFFGKQQKAADLVFGTSSGVKRPTPPFCNDLEGIDELGRGKVRAKANRMFGMEGKLLFFRVLKKSSTCEDDDSQRRGLCSGWASIIILNLAWPEPHC